MGWYLTTRWDTPSANERHYAEFKTSGWLKNALCGVQISRTHDMPNALSAKYPHCFRCQCLLAAERATAPDR